MHKLKEENKLTFEDKKFIKSNYTDYQYLLKIEEQRLKLAYPFFILIAGVLYCFFIFPRGIDSS